MKCDKVAKAKRMNWLILFETKSNTRRYGYLLESHSKKAPELSNDQ